MATRRWVQRNVQWVYWVGAAGLAPWIVALAVTQVPRAPAHDVHVLTLGLLLTVMASLATTAWLYGTGRGLAVMAASFAAAVTFISGWFRALTRTGGSRLAGSLLIFLTVSGTIVIVCAVAIRYAWASLTQGRPTRRWLPVALALSALALVPSLVVVVTVVPPVQIAHHLRVAWIGLDLFELAALVLTGLGLHRRSPTVIIPAAITGTLLVCDAWINVVPATGAARLEGLVLALVELPLAALSFWVAVEVTRRTERRSAPWAVPPPCAP
jgi:hypothetical protein